MAGNSTDAPKASPWEKSNRQPNE